MRLTPLYLDGERYSLSMVKVSQVMHLNFKRSSIIPYMNINGINYYAFFIDARHREITDGGGSVDRREHWLTCALRECFEESCGIFDFRSLFNGKTLDSKSSLSRSICYYNERNIYVMYEVLPTVLLKKSPYVFTDRYEQGFKMIVAGNRDIKRCKYENCHMIWLNIDEIINLVDDLDVLNPYHKLFKESHLKLKGELGLLTSYHEDADLPLPLPSKGFHIGDPTLESSSLISSSLSPDPERSYIHRSFSSTSHDLSMKHGSQLNPKEYLSEFLAKHENFTEFYPKLWIELKKFLKCLIINGLDVDGNNLR